MAQQHTSTPESSRFPSAPQPFLHTGQDLTEHDHEILDVRSATPRRVLTRSKLPLDVTAATYVGGSTEYRGETFTSAGGSAAPLPEQRPSRSASSGLLTTCAVLALAGAISMALLQVYIAVPVLLVASGLLYFSGRVMRTTTQM